MFFFNNRTNWENQCSVRRLIGSQIIEMFIASAPDLIYLPCKALILNWNDLPESVS